jgi:hypothetical protein
VLILLNVENRVLEVNSRPLSGAKHEPNDSAVVEACEIHVARQENQFSQHQQSIPRVCWNCCPSIVNRAFKNLATIGNNILNDVHM